MDLFILVITIIVAVVRAKNKNEQKKEQTARRRSRSAFEQAEQIGMEDLPREGSYRPGAVEERPSGREANLERQRRLKAELKRKYEGVQRELRQAAREAGPSSTVAAAMEGRGGDRHGAELREAAQAARERRAPTAGRPRQGGPGKEGRSRTTAAVTGAYSDEYLGSMLYDSAEGEGHVAGDYRTEELTAKSDDHVVRAFTESRHSHSESSMTGFDHCAPGPKERDAYEQPVQDAARVGLNAATLREAILYAEILGKPKALRRGRGW